MIGGFILTKISNHPQYVACTKADHDRFILTKISNHPQFWYGAYQNNIGFILTKISNHPSDPTMTLGISLPEETVDSKSPLRA